MNNTRIINDFTKLREKGKRIYKVENKGTTWIMDGYRLYKIDCIFDLKGIHEIDYEDYGERIEEVFNIEDKELVELKFISDKLLPNGYNLLANYENEIDAIYNKSYFKYFLKSDEVKYKTINTKKDTVYTHTKPLYVYNKFDTLIAVILPYCMLRKDFDEIMRNNINKIYEADENGKIKYKDNVTIIKDNKIVDKEKLLNKFLQENKPVQENKKSIKKDKKVDELQNIINEIKKISDELKPELIGNWIWVDGNTKPYKEKIKALNFRWSGRHKKWYKPDNNQYKRSSNKSFAEIKEAYAMV